MPISDPIFPVTTLFPTNLSVIPAWAEANGSSETDARHRYAQYRMLTAIDRVAPLREALVLKGGNALEFAWRPNRTSRDLNFSVDHAARAFAPVTEEMLRILFTYACLGHNNAHYSGWGSEWKYPTTLVLKSVGANPQKPGSTFTTYRVNIGYVLFDQPRLLRSLHRGNERAFMDQIVPLHISVNEPICAHARFPLENRWSPSLRVSTLDDIVAEKLRALLQQPIRNRERPQDVLDLAIVLRNRLDLDPRVVAEYLATKASARNVPVSKSAFHHPEIRTRAEADYDQLRATVRRTFIPFDEAFAVILAFTDALPIPD